MHQKLFTSIQYGSSCKGHCGILHIIIQTRNDFLLFSVDDSYHAYTAL